MTLEERADLVLAFARVLYVNGQSTDQTLASAERVGHTLGLRANVMARWGELQLQAQDADTRLISAVAADPTGVTWAASSPRCVRLTNWRPVDSSPLPQRRRSPQSRKRRHRLRLCGIDDSGRVHLQDGERLGTTCRWLAHHAGADKRDHRRRRDRHHRHLGDELRSHPAKAGHRSHLRQRTVDAGEASDLVDTTNGFANMATSTVGGLLVVEAS